MDPTIHPPASLYGIAFLQAVRRALPQLLLATIAAGLATYLAQSWITPRYIAEATLTVRSDDPKAAVEEHVRALKDPIRLFSVASELGLKEHVEFNGEDRGRALLAQLGLSNLSPFHGLQDSDERLLAAVYEKFAAAPGNKPGTIVVRLLASDPQLAAKFVNRLLEVYLASLWPAEADESDGGKSKIEAALWAEVPSRSVFPRKGPLAMLGMAVMLLIGLGALAIREGFRAVASHQISRRVGEATLAVREQVEAAAESRFRKLRTPVAAANRLLALPDNGRGYRTMVSGECADIDATNEAFALADNLSDNGKRVVLVRWSPGGGDITGGQSGEGVVGINDLIEGRATFEEIITRLPASRAHGIAAGSPVSDRKAALDPNLLSLVLDTLDEVYDHIVVVAEHQEARELFAALEGRFDVCLSVGEAGYAPGVFTADVDRYLGFDVTDIHIIRVERRRRAIAEGFATPALEARLA